MDKREKNHRMSWPSVISAVTTPLGFFTLVVLMIEVVLAFIVTFVQDSARVYLVASMILLLFLLVVIVAILALRSQSPTVPPPCDKTDARPTDGAAQRGKQQTILWEDIEDSSATLCDRIRGQGFEPDTLVGIGRGGAVVLGFVAARFRQRQGDAGRLHPVQLLDRRYLRRENQRRKTVIIGLHALDVQNRNVLLLNADSYSGTTLAEAKQAIKRLNPREVLTGTLYLVSRNGGGTTIDPDFYGRALGGQEAGIRLPWRGEHYKFEEAIDTAELAQRNLIVLHGLVGTGKTSVANVIVKRLRSFPLHTDDFWFKHGLRGRDRDPGISAEHYGLMQDLCWSVIGSGRDVVLDCTSRWRTFRTALSGSFTPWGVTLVYVRCTCSETSALQRIAERKRFGPHDMGDESEYRRVLDDYNQITEQEAAGINLVEVDTDQLTCSVAHAQERDIERVNDVCKAIEAGYLARLRPWGR